MALKLADYAITEAGFGADLGAEKFLDIKCRMAGLKPSAVVIVATVRALKYNGGVPKAELNAENLEALEKGMPNLLKHVSNIKNVYKLPCVVAINAFPTDTKAELDLVEEKCKELGVNVALSEVWAKGGEGGLKLAEEVIRLVEEPNDSHIRLRTGRFYRRQTEPDRTESIRWKTCRSDSKCSETGKTVRGSWLRQLPDLCG